MLTEAERKRCLYHLEYTLLELPTSLSLGLPIITQARLIVEQNTLNMDPGGEALVRKCLAELDCIEVEASKARRALLISKAGDTTFRDDALDRIWIEYGRWARKLADVLGAQRNPVSNAVAGMMGGVVEGC
jgi:hypothetical protein